jgi:hypothetical protein
MGIFEKIKQAFSNPGASQPVEPGNEFDQIISQTSKTHRLTSTYYWDIKLSTIPTYTELVATWEDKKKIDFIVFCIVKISDYNKNRKNTFSSADEDFQENTVRDAYIAQLFKTKLKIDEDDMERLVGVFMQNKKWNWSALNTWPVAPLLNQLSRQYKSGVPDRMVGLLGQIKATFQKIDEHYFEKDKLKIIEKIDQLVFGATAAPEQVKTTLFLGDDRFSAYANSIIEKLPQNERDVWYKLIARALKASGGKPSAKYLTDTKALFKELGPDKFKSVLNDWFVFVTGLKEVTTVQTQAYNDSTYSYSTSVFLSAVNVDAIKGFVWMCAHFHDNATLNNLAKLAERCYKKMPGVGPAAAAVGNACLFALYTSKGLDGIGHLSRLKLRVKQTTTQQIIERYIAQAATEKGVTVHEIEDMAVDDLGLVAGKRNMVFENYTCVLQITGVGRSEITWLKADDTEQKSVPSAVKEKQAARLKKIKELQKQVDTGTTAQRDRIDRMFRTGRKLTLDSFNQYFLNHGLMSFLAEKIIWNLEFAGNLIAAIQMGGVWVDNESNEITPASDAEISLWHPATSSVSEVKKWRSFLVENKIQQPLKQAFREVYLLTEAELNTRVYSNRMAAHVLKQHQFNMLAKTRGWKYSLLGAFDNGVDHGIAEIVLPEYGLKAQYWVNEVNADDAFNQTGIWDYVTTDQIRFSRITNGEVVNLIDVPVLPFSEVLRDVDLFVGVASIGNDPAWQDSGGVVALNNYWTSYSFGELSELAKNRKEILADLVPRLKISKVATIRDKFLVVEGKLRTYKIHIGSTNILMEPNDQYLCIVPDRSQKNNTENLFIPFEGDAGLSVILSKAFLLAEDDKITDRTITSQINQR